ncbi:uncharacterized protein HMPREF1120_09269 [Exophiala dermatitidis NIH/UT8656]|uniref:Uncharacterized protein n=1 Tax=Exophiala dermatitidis (strain ATCC 34100 / CBS 525.76 / NIH/UT8656) TaxID=858893 RepID=H6CC38_EXODN|nr:uncharacterized protein HMPREF1120_09269 [Exophiala dermatitidis NIH/UT8656]EHY61335.1 hypothetical protein HMPREF1120_09269 [Exophiala dermatitidis NIH/UT8656]
MGVWSILSTVYETNLPFYEEAASCLASCNHITTHRGSKPCLISACSSRSVRYCLVKEPPAASYSADKEDCTRTRGYVLRQWYFGCWESVLILELNRSLETCPSTFGREY